nr:hypothetical protein [Tanacetum cinerariifolium]
MEILLEPTSNKLMIILTKARNPIKKILLQLNLSDHRKLKDGGEGANRGGASRGTEGGTDVRRIEEEVDLDFLSNDHSRSGHAESGGARIAFEDEFGAAKKTEVSCEAQQGRSRVKRKLFRSCRNNMANEPILALPDGLDNYAWSKGDVRTLIMEEAYATKYSVRLRVRKMLYELVAESSGLLLQPEISDWKWEKERLTMDSKSKLPRSSSGCDEIWLGRLYVDEAAARHGVHVSSIPDRDGMYIESERTFRMLENMFRDCVINLVVVGILTFREVSFPTKIVIIRVFNVFLLEALYGRRGLRKPKIVKSVKLIVEMKLLEFRVGDHVMMKVTPCKGVVRFGKKGELAPSQPPPPPPIASTEAPHMVSSVKLSILKKSEYILWTMKMEQYLANTNYALWEVILNDENLARFRGIKDAKTLWAAIKTKFGGNAESKKMQKNILKQQFEKKFVSNSEGLDKGYDRFQRLLILLKIHGAGVSTKDANQKFLRSLPSAWSNISLIMRNQPGIDNMYIDDLYNNLKVYEANIKGSSGSSSNSQIVAFVYVESTISTNELNAAYNVLTSTCHSSQAQDQTDQDDLEKMYLKWQVAMLSIRVKRFYKKTRRNMEFNKKEPIGCDKTKVECFNCHRKRHFARYCKSTRNSRNRSRDARNAGYKGRDNGKKPVKKENEKALVVQDRLGYVSQFNEKEVLVVKEEEVTETVFDNRSSDEENSLANDRFKKDDSIYKFKISETVTSLTTNEKDAPETSTACVKKPKEDKSSAPFIQDWDTDSVKDSVFRPEHIPSKIDFVKAGKSIKHVKSVITVEPVKPIKTADQIDKSKDFSLSLKVDRKDWHVKMTQKLGLGFGFTKKACFVCGSMSHLIKDYTFHEDKIAEKSVLPNHMGKKTGHKECRPVWNNVQRLNHQNKFAPTTAFTRFGRIPVSAAMPKVTASTSAAKLVNTAGPGHPQQALKNKGIVDSGCSRHMIRNKAYLADYQEINDGGFASFGSSRGKITGKGPQDTSGNACTQDNVDAGKEVSNQHYIVLPLWSSISSTFKSSYDKAADDKPKDDIGSKTVEEPVNKEDQAYRDELARLLSQEKEASDAADATRKESKQGCMDQRGATKVGSTNPVNIVSNPVNATSSLRTFSAGGPSSPHPDAFIPTHTLLHMEPKKVAQALIDESWVEAITPIETQKPLVKDKEAADVDVYIYRSMISSFLQFLLVLDSPFDLEAYSDSVYVGANLDRKSTTGGCEFLGKRLISWQCKKQTIVATSTTETEYVVAANYRRQVRDAICYDLDE